MSDKLRTVNTKFWTDPWIEDLNFKEKLVFLYLLTNPQANILGVYEISIKRISIDTDLDIETVSKALEGFERCKKVFFKDNWVILSNFLKNQSMNTNMWKGANDLFNKIPMFVKQIILDNALKGFERLLKSLKNVNVKCECEYESESENESENVNVNQNRNSENFENIFHTQNFENFKNSDSFFYSKADEDSSETEKEEYSKFIEKIENSVWKKIPQKPIFQEFQELRHKASAKNVTLYDMLDIGICKPNLLHNQVNIYMYLKKLIELEFAKNKASPRQDNSQKVDLYNYDKNKFLKKKA